VGAADGKIIYVATKYDPMSAIFITEGHWKIYWCQSKEVKVQKLHPTYNYCYRMYI
jgi:hypothetical protein